jgi:hypothetical protein
MPSVALSLERARRAQHEAWRGTSSPDLLGYPSALLRR